MLSNLSLTRLFNSIKKNPFRFVHLPLILYWIFLFVMTSIPIEKIPKFFNTQDKLEHFAAYFILGVLIKLSTVFQNKSELIKKNSMIVSLIIITIYAMFDELHQLIIPGRYCDFYDWLFDFVGGGAGIILVNHFLKRDKSLVH